jgi:hypothetical protein
MEKTRRNLFDKPPFLCPLLKKTFNFEDTRSRPGFYASIANSITQFDQRVAIVYQIQPHLSHNNGTSPPSQLQEDKRTIMALFRRRKSAGGTRGNKLNHHISNSSKEEVLQGQVDDLQEEMKRINKRLVAMQAKVQNTGTLSPATVSFPTPLLSLRPGIHPEASIDRPSLPCDQFQGNQSFRKKKDRVDIFVPHEINFVSNELVYNGKNTDLPEICVSNIFQDEPPPPVREIDTRNDKDTKDIDSIKIQRKDIGYSSYSTNKVMTLQHCKNIRQSSLKAFGDAESITSSQRSTLTTKSRRKVRRIVRKVRAAPPPETTTSTTSISRASVPRERDETRSSLLPTIRSRQLGLSTKRPESLNERSRMKFCDVFIDDSIGLSFSKKPSTHSNEIKNEDDAQTSSQQTRTSSFVQHHKAQHTANSILLDKSQERQIHVTIKETKEKPESLDKSTAAQLHGGLLDQTHCDIIDRLDTEIVLHRPNLDAIDEFKSYKVLSSNHEPVGCIQSETTLKGPGKSRTIAPVHSKPSYSFLAHAQIDAKLKHVQNSVPKCLHPTSDLPVDIRADAQSNQIEESTEKAPNPKSGLHADIRSGLKLNKVIKSTEQNLGPTLDFRGNLQKGVKRGQVESSTATSPHSSAKLLKLKNDETSPIASQNPKNILLEGIKAGVKLKQIDRSTLQGQKKREKPMSPKNVLLEGIKAGVKLKQIDRSLLQGQKKRETPMSALLAKIQERKQECLRQEHQFVENPEQSGIDW